MKKHIIAFSMVLGLFLCSAPLMAQPGFDDEVTDAPIDGGLSILVGAGVAFGAKKIREKSKKAKV